MLALFVYNSVSFYSISVFVCGGHSRIMCLNKYVFLSYCSCWGLNVPGFSARLI